MRNLIRETRGSAAAEFALVLPVLVLLLLGIIKFGIVFSNYIQLSNGVAAGAHQLAISRGTSTAYSSTLAAMTSAAPSLHSFASPISGQSVTVKVAGTSCTSANQGGACQTAFAAGADAVVTATYPCDLDVLWVTVPGCAFTSSATEYIQ